MKRVSPFLVGLLFGIGLIVSGMTDPRKVLAFLDFAGAWDPSLAFVMVGAIIAAFAGFRLAAKRRTSFHLPTARGVDPRLIIGSLMFGVGWGLVGLCPGPAIANLGFLDGRAALFVASMTIGMGLCSGLASLPASRPFAEASLDG
jgi:uncharacterized membrane protein YedE/YeeE